MENGSSGRDADRTELERLLAESEQRLASIPELEAQVADLESDLAAARSREAAAVERARHLDGELTRSQEAVVEIRTSTSWRVTKPLRRAEQLLR